MPQLVHALWAAVSSPQLGQVTSVGASSFQTDERLELFLACEVFLAGTAMTNDLLICSLIHKLFQNFQPRVNGLAAARTAARVEIDAAGGTKSLAVLMA